MSPTAMCTRSRSLASIALWVPLPLPWTPMITYLRMGVTIVGTGCRSLPATAASDALACRNKQARRRGKAAAHGQDAARSVHGGWLGCVRLVREVPGADRGERDHTRCKGDDGGNQQDLVQAGGEGRPGDSAHNDLRMRRQAPDHLADLPGLNRRRD